MKAIVRYHRYYGYRAVKGSKITLKFFRYLEPFFFSRNAFLKLSSRVMGNSQTVGTALSPDIVTKKAINSVVK